MNQLPCVLVLAGLDPGGGAGIAADVRAVRVGGAFAAPVATAITVQSTAGLARVEPVRASLVTAQAREVIAHQRVRAIKVGALGNAANVAAVAAIVGRTDVPLVLDPVGLATRATSSAAGALVDARGFALVRKRLVPRATIVTANAAEASRLSGIDVVDLVTAERAARAIVSLGARAALVKGGHFFARGRRDEAIDVLVVGDALTLLAAPRITRSKTRVIHGAGCVLASLVAARLARTNGAVLDVTIARAVRFAKRRHHAWLARGLADVGGPMRVLA
ncbi:MAG: bifunctional hydroxymethylpyrimidine kinase/phosphomethylpyrimidine kinase [Polyangiaceae bacterium]